MAEPLVSVVTPSYNQVEFIEDTILSVKNQAYDRIEHVVVDGGSTDGTLDVLRRYEDEYPLTWTSEPDEGQSDAINEGFERTNGDVVGWLNSDDVYFDTGVFSRVARYFEEYGTDVVYGDVCLVDGDSTVYGVSARPPFDVDQLVYRNLIAQPATFFRGDVVRSNALEEDLTYSMDYEYWLRLSLEHSFVHVPDVLAGFRIHEAQKTREIRAMDDEGTTVARRYYDEESHQVDFLRDVVPTELRRLRSSVALTLELGRDPPQLAFPGQLASTPRMLANVLPERSDVRNAVRRVWKM